MRSPSCSMRGPPSSLPSRILGPCKSQRMPIGRLTSSDRARRSPTILRSMSWPVWLILIRKTSTPASNSWRIFSGVFDDGPSVARILVLRRRRMGGSIDWRGLIGKRLGPVRLLAGIHFKEAAAVEAAFGALPAPHRLEALVRRHAEMGLAFPGACRAIAGVKIIIAALQGAGQDLGAGFGVDGPPAFAGPVGAVETAKGGAHALCRFVADREAGFGRSRPGQHAGEGRGKGQKGGDAAH